MFAKKIPVSILERNLSMMAFLVRDVSAQIAADASPSGTKNGGCRCTRAHALRWQITARWGWMPLLLQVATVPDHPQESGADPLYEKTGCTCNDASD